MGSIIQGLVFLAVYYFHDSGKTEKKNLGFRHGGGGMTALGDCDTVSKPGMTFMGGIPGLKA